MIAKSVDALIGSLAGSVTVDGDEIEIQDERIIQEKIDDLIYSAVFGEDLVRDVARWLIWEIGQELGISLTSIHELYMAAGRGELPKIFTVPAINVRAMNFNTSRAIFRAANKLDVGAMLFEIARSEMNYTGQRPIEYSTSVLAAAIKEGFRGPIFIQGDHFQISAKNFAADPEEEVAAVKELISEALDAGFYNIDIDSSTLVDLSFDALNDQQRNNYQVCAELTRYVREQEPQGVTVSLGGEIGEVGGHNSTVAELNAFMEGYNQEIRDTTGISKISVQTGTSHGGVVLPDGTLAQVSVDFDTLKDLSREARNKYSLGGAVQHGASTLPASAFGKFPESEAIEIHLATNFQNIIYDNLPEELVAEAYDYVRTELKNEWKEGKTEDQFLYSSRKKAIGPFKKQWWDVDVDVKSNLGDILQEQFEFLFTKLNVTGTKRFTQEVTTVIKQHRPRPLIATKESQLKVASDLAD
ncbi:MAG TPA: class II fructose-bisphosphate aldolase [candidate division Zixibacteria bacterium]|nr:class II fructose-bisphosphate aldolase [candidate division Zixibacteria bacterium]